MFPNEISAALGASVAGGSSFTLFEAKMFEFIAVHQNDFDRWQFGYTDRSLETFMEFGIVLFEVGASLE